MSFKINLMFHCLVMWIMADKHSSWYPGVALWSLHVTHEHEHLSPSYSQLTILSNVHHGKSISETNEHVVTGREEEWVADKGLDKGKSWTGFLLVGESPELRPDATTDVAVH